MNVALMQPYLFPYLGYFGLIDAVDVFVLFDHVQYHRRGWMHRNRIHHPTRGWTHVGVQVEKAPREAIIRDIRLKPGWQGRLLDDIAKAYRGRARFADHLLQWLAGVLDLDTHALHELNAHTLEQTSLRLGLTCRFESAAGLHLARDPALPLWDWARQACARVGGTAYLNLPGGEALYPPEPFVEQGLQLGVLQPQLEPYDRSPALWEAGLSVLDVLAHCTPEQANALARSYAVSWKTSG
jgi:hypothetical protein